MQINLAALETTIQKYHEAIAILEPLVQTPPPSLTGKKNTFNLFMLGSCYLYKGEYVKATESLEGALAQIPYMVPALSALGETYLKTGDIEKASVTLDKALAINPNAPPVLYYKGLVLEKKADVTAAQKSYQKAYAVLKEQLNKNGENGEDYYLMFLICQKLTKNEEGETYKAEAAQLLFTCEAPWQQK